MSQLTWDAAVDRKFETGVKNGVLYKEVSGAYPLGVAWNGLTAVTERASGGEPTPMYADDIKYLNLLSTEEFEATIEAYTYPEEFEECDGSGELSTGVQVGQQSRVPFGMAYKTVIGNADSGYDYGYKLHLIYGALAAPSDKNYQTINDTPDAIAFSWDVTTTPVSVTGLKPTASIVIDSTKVDETNLATLETVLFGSVGVDPRLPLPDEVKSIIEATPDAVAVDTYDPADEETGVGVTDNITLTFNNAMVQENVLLMTDEGVPVAVTKTWDATAKILTVNPDASLTASTTYIVVTDGCVDMYGQLLATETIWFTTAA